MAGERARAYLAVWAVVVVVAIAVVLIVRAVS